MTIRTAEFVTPKHPDKVCDFIADSILDAYLTVDTDSRVAVEVMGGHGLITLNGEITSSGEVNCEQIVKDIVGPDYRVIVNIAKQSPEIAQGVDAGGAGDQGIMTGYACRETDNFMPLEYEIARRLCREVYKHFPVDGKVQVTVEQSDKLQVISDKLEDSKIKTVVVSFQNTKTPELLELVKSLIVADEYLINPAGEWSQGGFDADSGLSGRKLVVDNYGPRVVIGGGSFSGKDYTKVDRSGAYMARRIAVDYLEKYSAQEISVRLAYAIGKAEPVMAEVDVIDAQGESKNYKVKNGQEYDLSPRGIAEFLDLKKPIYAQTCQWGHCGVGFRWG